MTSPCRSPSGYATRTTSSSPLSSSTYASDDEQPCCSRSLFTMAAPTSPAASTAQNTKRAVKRKIDEVDSSLGSGEPPRKCLRKTKYLTPPSTPEASPRSTSPETAEINSMDISEEEAVRRFNVDECLSGLFGYPVHSSLDPTEEAIKHFDPEACATSLFSLSGRSILSCLSKKCLRAIPRRKGRTSDSCSRKIHDTGSFSSSNAMYKNWNTYFLHKLQKEIHHAQQTLSPTLVSRIQSIKIPSQRLLKPIVYTTIRNHASHRLDWGKLQVSISYLSAEKKEPIGEQSAKEAIQRVCLLCRQRKERVNRISISGSKLTRWCAAALLAQEIRVHPELHTPMTYILGHRRFISGERDIAAAHADLEGFLNSRSAVSLLRCKHITDLALPDPLPEHSDDSPDSQAET